MHGQAVGVLKEDDVLHAQLAPLLGKVVLEGMVKMRRNLVHEEMNVAMAVWLEDDVTILLRGDRTCGILQCGDAVLFHEGYMIRMQSVVVVLLQKREDAVCERREERTTRHSYRHWS